MIYNKSLPWEHTVNVRLDTAAAGNQLNLGGDVKERGVIVGTVKSINVVGRSVQVTLAIAPKYAKSTPDNVKARILPKTLFGERFVDLVLPATPSGVSLEQHPVIAEDRSEVAIETGKVFNDLLPLLRTLHPVELNETLSALAGALENRGNALGENAVISDRYFAGLNPHLGTINHDISGLADLASSYADAAPDLLRLLRNSADSLQNVVIPKQNALVTFFRGTRGFANTTRKLLSDNEQNFIDLGNYGTPILGVMKYYSSIFPCLLRGLTDIQPRVEGTFATGPYLYVHLEVINRQGAEYIPGADAPTYSGIPAQPSCAGLPQPGVKFTYPHPGVTESTVQHNDAIAHAIAWNGDIGAVGSRAEVKIVGAVASPLLDTAPRQVPSFTDMLLGPLLRGSAVSYG
jgi:virulence factor Mce-like protein